jgi:hypothetical protein
MRTITAPIAPSETQTCEVPQGWTPEQQMAHMLELCEAQMESAIAESDQAVDALVRAFTSLADTTRSIESIADTVPPESRAATATALNEHVGAIREQVTSAVVAFQFYDKLSQRLGHVRYSLSTLAMFVCDRSQASQREQWERLFGTLRRLYRTEEEREIFQLMVNGASAEEARAQAEQHAEDLDGRRAGDIELF